MYVKQIKENIKIWENGGIAILACFRNKYLKRCAGWNPVSLTKWKNNIEVYVPAWNTGNSWALQDSSTIICWNSSIS